MRISFFSRISSTKMDRFTSNQDQNDQRPILRISVYVIIQVITRSRSRSPAMLRRVADGGSWEHLLR